MKLEDILKKINYKNVVNQLPIMINGFSNDTRNIKENDLYFGIKGENFDGNTFYKEAFIKGASVCILDNLVITSEITDYLKNNNKSLIIVNNTIEALGEIAAYKRSLFKGFVVAITGSAGKTSTKDMIFSVLKTKFNTLKTVGNHNNHIGLPLTILSLKDEECLVLEMGMNHLGEISYLTKIAMPNVAIITNVGTAHIGILQSRENILKAKLEILDGLNKDGYLIINNDNVLLHDWYLKNKGNYNIITFGLKNDSLIYPQKLIINKDNSTFNYHNFDFLIPVGGEHFVYNSLAAIAVASIYKITNEKVLEGIKNFELSSNRMDIINNNEITIINDSYNANYDALCYAIKYLGGYPGRKIAVLGTMRELGDFSQKLHTLVGNEIFQNKIDILITVGEYTELINNEAIKKGFNKNNSYHFDNNQKAIDLINKIKSAGDTILVKASFLCNFKEIVDKIS